MTKSSIARTTLAFALLGPGIGALVVIVPIVIADAGTLFIWDFAAAVLLWAYALAVLPAVATGLAWSYMFKRIPSVRSSRIVRVTAGAAAGTAIAAFAGWLTDQASTTQFVGAFALCGAVAGGLLAGVFPLSGWQQAPPL